MMGVLPWFVPGVVLSMAIASFLGRRVGQILAVHPGVAWAILVGFGVIVSATLTPLHGALNLAATGIGTCDFSRIGPAPIEELIRLDETSLNVVLFIPLGVAIGFVRRSRPRGTLILAAGALPFAIEAIQLVVPVLDRGCQSADVVDNLTGLLIGIAIGMGLMFLRRRDGSRLRPEDSH